MRSCRDRRAAKSAGMLGAASTVYLGGGTPSLIGGERSRASSPTSSVAPGAEVTVECNPESTSLELLETLAAAGVTRISLGVQSLRPAVLASLGATSRARLAVSRRLLGAIVAAAGFAEALGRPRLRRGRGARRGLLGDARGGARLRPAPASVSAYALTVEPGTGLGRDRARHPDDDVLARRYALADEMLTAAGYGWYEISNFARPGHESRHNLAYWEEGDYLGFGCAAHSHLEGRRFSNVVHIERYLDRIERAPRRSLARSTSLMMNAPSRRSRWRCGRRTACPSRRSISMLSVTSCRSSATRRSSTGPAVCSPTKSPSICRADRAMTGRGAPSPLLAW